MDNNVAHTQAYVSHHIPANQHRDDEKQDDEKPSACPLHGVYPPHVVSLSVDVQESNCA